MSNPPPDLQTMRGVLTELLRLYDWRFELAKREAGVEALDYDYRRETKRLLNQYGREKKEAWEAARRILATPDPLSFFSPHVPFNAGAAPAVPGESWTGCTCGKSTMQGPVVCETKGCPLMAQPE